MVASCLDDGHSELLDSLLMQCMGRVVYNVADLVSIIAETVLGLLERHEFARPPTLGKGARVSEGYLVNNSLLDGRGEQGDRRLEVLDCNSDKTLLE